MPHPLSLSVPFLSSHSNRDVSMKTKEALGFSLTLRQLQEATKAKFQLKCGLALELEGLTKNYEDQQFRVVQEQEDQWIRMAEQMDTTFREVLPQLSQTYAVRLLPWFLSATAKSGAGPSHSLSEALTAITTSELQGTTAPASMSSPAHRVSTLPPVLPQTLALKSGTNFFALALDLKHKKWDHSHGSTPEGQSGKRAHACTEEGSISSGGSTLPN